MRTIGVLLIAVLVAVAWVVAILAAGPLMFALVQSLPHLCASSAWLRWMCALYPAHLDATNYAQLSASLLSAGFAALAAIAASWLTAAFLLKQQREKDAGARKKAAAAIALEIAAFLKTFERLLLSAHLERRLSADRKKAAVVVSINTYDLAAALPPRATYDQVITEIASLDGVALPIALFYRQAGRVQADIERGWISPPAFGHLFVKAADAALALAPFSKITDEKVAEVYGAIWILLHPDFQKDAWNEANPKAVYMFKAEETRCIGDWSDLAAKRKIGGLMGPVTTAYPVRALAKASQEKSRAPVGFAARPQLKTR